MRWRLVMVSRIKRLVPVTVNDVLDGHVKLDLQCLDRVYLNGYLARLQVGGQLVQFLRHRGFPIPSGACLQQLGDAFRRGVASFARANHVPVVPLKAADRNIEVMQPYLDAAAWTGRSQVAAIGIVQGAGAPAAGAMRALNGKPPVAVKPRRPGPGRCCSTCAAAGGRTGPAGSCSTCTGRDLHGHFGPNAAWCGPGRRADRAAGGAGGRAAMLRANTVALVATSAPPGLRRAALGVQAAAQSLGLALGTVADGLLLSAPGWRWIFINVPVGVTAVAAGWLLPPRARQHPGRADADPAGLVLLVTAVTAGLIALRGLWPG